MANEAKQDPVTGILAQKTVFDGPKSWRVYRLSDGKSHYVSDEDVAGWYDLVQVVPDPPE